MFSLYRWKRPRCRELDHDALTILANSQVYRRGVAGRIPAGTRAGSCRAACDNCVSLIFCRDWACSVLAQLLQVLISAEALIGQWCRNQAVIRMPPPHFSTAYLPAVRTLECRILHGLHQSLSRGRIRGNAQGSL